MFMVCGINSNFTRNLQQIPLKTTSFQVRSEVAFAKVKRKVQLSKKLL